MFGHRLATFESHEVNFRVDVEAGRDYDVALSVPRPNLNPGRYFLSVSLSSGHTYFDVLLHAATFDVTPIDVATGDYFEPIPAPVRCGCRIRGRARMPAWRSRPPAHETPHPSRHRRMRPGR